jgi:AhpD family alkylhydroperoxidase
MRFDPYASDVEAYDHLLELAVHLARGPLDPVVKNLVEIRASQVNGCAFCLGLHTPMARAAGVSQEKLDVLAGWRESSLFTSRERAALALVEEMARIGDGSRVSEGTWSAARSEFDEAELANLLYVIGLITLWNTLNVAVEFPEAAGLPGRPAKTNPA